MAKKKKGDYNKFKESACVACGVSGDVATLDIDHFKTRGSRPDLVNDSRNCLTLCRFCHHVKGTIGADSFVRISSRRLYDWLKRNGWEYDDFSCKWFLGE